MKVAFIGGFAVPDTGGIENYIFNLAKHLKSYAVESIIICRGREKSEKLIDGIRIIQLKNSLPQPFSYLSLYIRGTKFVVKSPERYDAINYQYFFMPGLYSWMAKRKGIKIFTTIHSFPSDSPKHGRLASLLLQMEWKISKHFLGQVISVSEHVSGLVSRRLGLDSLILRGGVDLPEIKQTNGDYFLFIGRIDPVKGLETLIDAYCKLQSGKRLLIAGNTDSKYAQSLVSMAANDDRILFVGPVSGLEKRKLLSGCLAFILPSYSEGFPISLLEAMSYSKPCIASNISANKEVLSKELGLWFNPGDADGLASLLKRVENREIDLSSIGESLYERVASNFVWDLSARRFVSFLK